tara:strand:- start:3921 stop:4175 length:255 start_codon:yes stop_codon:yes gene_type:complete
MMFEDAAMLWNGVLTIAIGAFLWWIRGTNSQIDNLWKLLSQTREEIPKTYATKVDVARDVEKIMDRFDRLDSKMDSLLERINRG